MTTSKSLALIGATGLIGSHLLKYALDDVSFSSVTILVRRPFELNHPKLRVVVVDFENQEELNHALQECELVFCSVGTTSNKVKSNRAAYRKVDVDIPLAIAKASEVNHANHFLLVSSVGANPDSANFYLKMKGEVEQEVNKLAIPAISIYRPSMLLGKRTEFRLAESIFQPISSFFAFLTPSIYKPIQAEQVAKAMIRDSKLSLAGMRILHYREMI